MGSRVAVERQPYDDRGRARVTARDADRADTRGDKVDGVVAVGYLGTVVTDGRGLMLVTATGMRTEVGKIGLLIDETVRRETPLERRLESGSGAR